MVDTQILSYAYKEQSLPTNNFCISSVVAHEFLEIYHSGWPTRFRYYVKYLGGRHLGGVARSPAHRKNGMIERIVLDFGIDYPQLIEFNSRATAAIINDKNLPAYCQILSSLDKKLQKKLRSRFAFLCNHVAECKPLTTQTAELGIELLWRFMQHHNVKGAFRNSVNDMLILASAIASKDDLITEDSLLARFAARERGISVQDAGLGTVKISFGAPMTTANRTNRESKGYINRGWKIAEDVRRMNQFQY